VPNVSQYRLTAHLTLAIVIYGYMLWVVFDLLHPARLGPRQHAQLARHATWLSGFILLTIVSGGFVAGLDAGFTFNTFPLMGDRWIPQNVLYLQPLWRNFFENIATVQFDHRVLAITLAAAATAFWFAARRQAPSSRLRLGLNLLLAAVALQVTLGISTLLLVVPTALAAAHQAGALLLLTASLYVTHQFRGARASI
jgi:cytochrome c oxidase assembly protein subunit 15